MASSDDGTKLVATDYGGHVHTSTDSGITWTARDSTRNWNAVASSADGSKLVAVVQYGQIYASTDFGVTWTARDSNRDWQAVASLADGNKLAAGDNHSQLYTLANNRTTLGTSGYLTGSQYDAIELQYIGNNLFMPLSATSYSGSFTVY